MLKRPLYSLLLAFALLFVQQGALWHEVTHTPTSQNSQQDQPLPHTEQCEKCVAFAHMGAAPTTAPILFTLSQAAQVRAHFIAPAARQTLSRPYQSRAPPALA